MPAITPPEDRQVCDMTFYVRYAETDAMGVVHHAQYLVYCEEARSQFARDTGASYADFEKEGLYLVVSDVQLRFLTPAVYGQRIRIQAWIQEIKSRRIIFAYRLSNPDTDVTHVTGTTWHICTTHKGKLARIPEKWINRWQLAAPPN
jgi:acyl-CoA thioester hydrolase